MCKARAAARPSALRPKMAPTAPGAGAATCQTSGFEKGTTGHLERQPILSKLAEIWRSVLAESVHRNKIYQNLYMIVTIRTNLQKYVVQKIQYTPMWLFVFITIQQLSRGSFHAVENFSLESFFQNRGGLQSIFHIANLATWLIAPYPKLTKWNLRSSHHSKRCCNSATQQTDFLQRRILADLHYGFCVHHCVLLGAQESMDNKIRNRIFYLQTWEF